MGSPDTESHAGYRSQLIVSTLFNNYSVSSFNCEWLTLAKTQLIQNHQKSSYTYIVNNVRARIKQCKCRAWVDTPSVDENSMLHTVNDICKLKEYWHGLCSVPAQTLLADTILYRLSEHK